LERIAEEAYLASKGQCLTVGLIVLREAIYIRQEMGRPVGGRKRPNGRW
jgi:hypothetical protein